MPQVQHDFGEGPCLAAFAEDRVVAVEDLRRELVWDRIAVVVRQLQVRGVLSVPAFAVVTAELVRTAVELANHQVEVAQLRRALAGRVWIEQAKGMVAATEGVSLDAAFQQLRGRARGLGRPSRRGRPPRPGWPGRQATMDRAQDDLAARERAADRRERLADERDRAADDRNHVADARQRAADVRDRVADQRDRDADKRDRGRAADQRDQAAADAE